MAKSFTSAFPKEWRQGYLFIAPAILALVALILYPTLYVVRMSLLDNPLMPNAQFVGLKHFKDVFRDPVSWEAFRNTLVFTVLSVLAHLIIGMSVALLLNRQIGHCMRSLYRGIMILPWLFTSAVVATIWRLIYHPLGVLNSLLLGTGLYTHSDLIDWLGSEKLALLTIVAINTWRGFPFVFLMILAGLQSLPGELHEAAMVDGASGGKEFLHITLPLLKPVLLTVGILDTIWSVRHFDLVFLLTGGGPRYATQLISTYIYQRSFQGTNFGFGSAMALVILIVSSLLGWFYIRSVTSAASRPA